MTPKYGDVLIRDDAAGGFDVVDAISNERVSKTLCDTLEQALVVARLNGGRIWHQLVDHRGRPLTAPALLHRAAQVPTES